MAWNIELADGCAVVSMNTNKFNVQNALFLLTFTMRNPGFTRALRKAIVET
jgi:hypothetical protein